MHVLIKLLKLMFFLAMLGGLFLYVYADQSAATAAASTADPSASISKLRQITGTQYPPAPERECEEFRVDGTAEIKLQQAANAVSYNGLVEEAQSAEAAAFAYAGKGDIKMARVAATDAIGRWERAMDIRRRMRCNEIELNRKSY